MRNIFFALLIIVLLISCGSLDSKKYCTPVLFPYSQYNYTPEVIELKKKKVESLFETIEINGIKIPIFENWEYEKFLSGYKMFKDKKAFFVNFNKNMPFKIDQNEIEQINIVGCTNFKQIEPIIKTQYEYFYDLYFTTLKNIPKKSGFWEYWILYNKTTFFPKNQEIKYYKGDKLEAFRRGSVDKCDPKPVFTIFFKNTRKVNNYSMGANFQDEEFFVKFFETLNLLN